LDNKLAVFADNKEEMVLIDFQAVEGQLIFFIRQRAMYKIKDYWDLIQTPEGVIINLRDGIYVTSGDKRDLISLPINDIMKGKTNGISNYETSSIYYNTYEKELMYFYGTPKKLLVYRFETGSWSHMDFTGVTIDNSIDIIDDYSGNMYVVVKDGKVYKMEYNNDIVATFGLSNIDLQELDYAKRLNSITTDTSDIGEIEGMVEIFNTKIEKIERRQINTFNRLLADRKPNDWMNFFISFKGIFYNMGLNFEAFSKRKT